MRTCKYFCIACALFVVGLARDCSAELFWDSNGASAGGSASDTAPGTWGSDSFWSGDANGLSATGPWAADELAVFSADTNVVGAYNVAVSGSQSASGLRFEEGTVTLTGGTINLTGGATINSAQGLTSTIGSVLSGSVAVTQSGNGTVVLTGANNYTLETKLASNPNLGTFNILRIGASEVIPNTSVIQILGQNSIFDLNGKTETVKSIATVGGGAGAFANSRIDVGTGTLIIADELNQVETYQSQLYGTGGGKINKTGAGQLNLASTSGNWEGEFILSGGLLGIGVNNALGTFNSSTSKLTFNGGTITFFNTGSRSLQMQNVDIINDFGALIGASNMELLGAADANMEGTTVITLKTSNPTITVNNTAGTSGTFIFRGAVVDDDPNDNVSRGITKAGAGVLSFNHPGSNYGGDTTILAGQVRIDANATIGNGQGTVRLAGAGTGLLTTTGRDPINNPVPNPIAISADSLIGTTRAQVEPNVIVNFTSNSITTTAGVVTFRNDAAAGGAQPANVFDPRFSGSGFNFSSPIVIAAGSISALRTTRLSSANATGVQTYSGDISGPGKFRRMTAGGETILTGANTFTGGTEVEDGTLTISGTTATAGGGNVSVTGGTLKFLSGVADGIANVATLSISGTGKVDLGAGINDVIAALSLGGSLQGPGTYGSAASGAQFPFDQWFTGTGRITVASQSIAGDFDGDNDVDSVDFNHATLGFKARFGNDLNGANFLEWQRNFGTNVMAASAIASVPEPASSLLAVFGIAGALARAIRKKPAPATLNPSRPESLRS